MKRIAVLFSLLVVILAVQLAFAQTTARTDPHAKMEKADAGDKSTPDPTVVDSKHYKVVFENDQVRVLRINYGAHEKSVMHYHPEGIAVFLTGGKGKFTFPDGNTQDIEWNAGDTIWLSATKHLPENLNDQPFELIQVEMKAKPASDTKSLY